MISVSFILPCFNYAKYLPDAISSIAAVIGDADEIIVVDDGSQDDTAEIVQLLLKSYPIQYVYQDNAGVSSARNHGARLAKSDYLSFVDADDKLLADGFIKLREKVEQNLACALVFGGHQSRHADKVRLHTQQVELSDTRINFVNYVIRKKFSIANGGTALIKRETALKYPYPENLKVSEDFSVYAWVLANEKVACINDPVVEILKHDDSLRNQSAGYADVVERLPDVVFDPNILPASLMKYKSVFYCNRLMSLFRIQYVNREYAIARQTYRRAIRCRTLNLFKLSYLKKYIRLLVL